jgi:D-glycero-D-manno-heptose 1,7-bisphosphate phosphatase
MGILGVLMQRAVFLDRDGVLNKSYVRNGIPCPPLTLSELQVLPGVPEALDRLRLAGFRLIVVTNQPDVARGMQTTEGVEKIHASLKSLLGLDTFFVCYHDDSDACACRKPEPGLLLAAAQQERIDLRLSYMIGDRWKDIEAGRRAGCTTIFVDHGYTERQPEGFDRKVTSLASAVDYICLGEGGI